jgi:Tfp pilus assembly protein PilN
LGLKETEESLNLLPPDIREKTKEIARHKEWLQVILFICGIILVLGLGVTKSLDNKALYLKQLKTELNKISKDARPLEEIEKRIKFVEGSLQKKPSSLEVLYELHRSIPSQISLTDFSYEEAGQIVLRGQTLELNSVFAFVSQLENSPALKEFNIKVRYATKKKTRTGEIIDFEIACLLKK